MSLIRGLVVAAVLLAACGGPPSTARSTPSPARPAPTAEPATPPPRPDGRLPDGIRPTRVHVELMVDPSQPTFSGRVRIGVEIERPTRVLVLHGRGLSVLTAAVSSASQKQWAKTSFRAAAHGKQEPEELVLVVPREVPAGPAEIDIQYEAPFAKNLQGLYRVEEGGRHYAFTQFEPNDARRAFPCFDEPGFKIPWKLTVVAPEGNLVVANTPELGRRENLSSGLVTYDFVGSPPLPSYLVALAVGPFEVLQGPRAPVPIRLIGLPGKTRLGKLALEAAHEELMLLADYFGVGYPYAKLDLVAVPEFGAGAMENPGLITFREERLLLDEHTASTDARRGLAGLMAHELAHQWFGNLVTAKWWDDLWLNEGFASWMGGKIVDRWRPSWGVPVERISGKQWVMGLDALGSARQIRQPVRSSSEALEAFDGVTYVKAMSVLEMVESWVGPAAFQQGLRDYLARHRFANAAAADLYAALGQASSRDVAGVMTSFTDQSGVPLIDVKASCDDGYGPERRPARIALEQRAYRPLGAPPEREAAPTAAPTGKRWRMPVCLRFDAGRGERRECLLLEGREAALDLGSPSCPRFVQPNADEAGYYRYRLAVPELRALFRDAPKRLSPRERVGLVGNAWALVVSGDLPAGEYLSLITHLKDEPDHVVWEQIVESLRRFRRALVTNATAPAFAQEVTRLLGPAARRLGWRAGPGEDDQVRLLRKAILEGLGELGDDDASRAKASELAEAWLARPDQTDADLASIALPLAARRGDAKLFDRILDRMRRAATPEQRVIALGGLTGFDDPALVIRVLDAALDGTIKVSDLRYVFGPLFERPAALATAHAWLREHVDALAVKLPSFVVGRLPWVMANLCDAQAVDAAHAFFRPHMAKIEGAEKHLAQALEAGKLCAALAAGQRESATRALGGAAR